MPHGGPTLRRGLLMVTVEDGRIISYELIGEPARLRGLALAVLDG
ncbi:hypothetical protein ABZ845_09485 [Streptomyces sp. NPDC047022]